jgi:lipopolysaccharide transport system permease protein
VVVEEIFVDDEENVYSVLNPKGNLAAFRELVLLLTKYRTLTIEMAKREIMERYSGQLFGVLWAFGHPLALMIVYAFVFGFVFKVNIGGTPGMPLDYTTYLLSGFIPWLAIQDTMSKSSTLITSNANLVKQFVFPTEILPMKGVIATLLTECVFLVLLVMYVVISNHYLAWTYILLPVVVLLQGFAMIGISYVLSAVGVYIRDVKDFVQVFATAGVYLIPAFYLPDFVPALFRPLLYLNPFSYLIWCYQDALYFGRFEHWWAWIIWTILGLGIFIVGYRFFRKLKPTFGNVI